MSMTKTMVGDIEVWTGDGYVDLRQPGEPEDDHDLISIPVEYVPAVALALLGDRDALVERAARAYFNAYWDADHYHPTPYSAQSELDKEQYRTVARAMLAAIGGAAGEGSGEHANRRG